MRSNLKKAVTFIEKHGALLVFPIKDREQPLSLWKCFYPRSQMHWDWSAEGDDRVADLWHLRAALSNSRAVIYTKWFQGRATFFSQELFAAMLSLLSTHPNPLKGLPPESITLLDVLEDDSPLATRALRSLADMEGRSNETRYTRGLRELWKRLLIVGYGEVEEGGFPSLATGASRLLFEELWDESKSISEAERESLVLEKLGAGSAFFKQYLKMKHLLPNPDAPA